MDDRPRVVIVDVRNGKVKDDGTNIDLPVEGQESALHSIAAADVVVEIFPDQMFVRAGFDKHIVLLLRTKSESQINAEKAERDKDNRTNSLYDDLKTGEHPVDEKFTRVWDKDFYPSKPVDGGLKGF